MPPEDTAAATTAAASTTAATTAAVATAATTTATTAANTDAAKGYWPDDWRAKIAGDDPKELKQAERYADPAAVWKKARALEARLSSGELRSTLPADATPEEVTQWRKDNGIPEKPDAYEIKLADGRVVGEADRAQVNKFLEQMHGANASPAQVNSALNAYYQAQEEAIAAREQADDALKTKIEDEFRTKWGADYRRNLNMIHGVLSMGGQEWSEKFVNARLADGTPFFSDPATLEFFVNLARETNPQSTVVPAGTANPGQTIDAELATMQKMMGDRKSDYWRKETAAVVQQRYRDLLDAKAQLQKRAA